MFKYLANTQQKRKHKIGKIIEMKNLEISQLADWRWKIKI